MTMKKIILIFFDYSYFIHLYSYDKSISSALNFDQALYDLEISSGSFVSRILEGQVKLSKEVTR